MGRNKRQKMPRRGKVTNYWVNLFSHCYPFVQSLVKPCGSGLFVWCTASTRIVTLCTTHVRFIVLYQSSFEEAFYFHFLLSCIDHRLLTFISFFHFFNLYLYIHIPIYISRHLLTTKMHIHTHIHMFYIFYFPHQNPSTLPTNRRCKSKKRTRNIFFIYKTRYERKSGPAYLFPQLVIYHIIVVISNETCNMKTWNKNNQR